jgi:Flp pilus assembly protein TadG
MNRERGTSAVEFAIVFPLLVLLLFGIVEFSLILYDKAMLTNASREGARAGIVSQLVRKTDAEIKSVVDNYSKNYLLTFGSANTPVVTVTRTGLQFGDELSVKVTYTYGFLALPNFVTGIVGPMNLTATTIMRME